jgi:hypothetical protein
MSFISKLLSNILSKIYFGQIQKQIDKDPVMKAKQQRITKLGDDIRKRIEKYKKTDPEKYKRMKDLFDV